VRVTGVFLSLCLVLLGCSEQVTDSNVLRLTLQDDVKTLDPVNAYDEISLTVIPNILEPLYDYDYISDKYAIRPVLAATMPKVFDNGLRVVIPLRKGVYFAEPHAREVKAKDFVLSLKRLADPRAQSVGAWVFEGRLLGFDDLQSKWRKEFVGLKRDEANTRVIGDELLGIKALDDYTLELRFVKPYPQLLYALTLGFTSPMHDEFYRLKSDDSGQIHRDILGTGPYRVTALERGSRVILERSSNYRNDPVPAMFTADAGKMMPLTPKVVFHIIKETQPAWLKFLSGDLDVMRLALTNVEQALKGKYLSEELHKKGVSLHFTPAPTAYWISFNFKEKLFSNNKFLRQALSLGLDRQAWIKTFYKGYASPQVRANPLTLLDQSSVNSIKYDYNLEKAKAMLAKAGYPSGEGLPMLTLEMRSSDAISRQMGEFLKTQYGQMGIKITPMLNTLPALLEKQKNSSWQMMLGGWYLDYPEVENMYQLFYSKNSPPGANANSYANDTFDTIFLKFLTLNAGSGLRAKLVNEMEALVQEEVPWAYGVIPDTIYLSQKRIRNYIPREFGKNTLKYLAVEN